MPPCGRKSDRSSRGLRAQGARVVGLGVLRLLALKGHEAPWLLLWIVDQKSDCGACTCDILMAQHRGIVYRGGGHTLRVRRASFAAGGPGAMTN